ncbi:MAG: hypothetical protein AABZ08_03435 [Planctomycetota bacterium]
MKTELMASIVRLKSELVCASRRTWVGVVSMALAAIGGFGLVVLATGHGAGLSADSAFYLGVANELAAGHGLTVPWGTPEPTPLGTRWGPFMPAVLAAIAQFGPHPVDAIRWVNAICLMCTALICGVAVWKATGSTVLSVVISMLLATSCTALDVHAMAWSEPIFILFAVLALALMATYLRTRQRVILLAAFGSVVASCLTRYAGASLAVTVFLCLLFQPARWRYRIAAMGGVVLLGMLPMAPGAPSWIHWMLEHLGGAILDAPKTTTLQTLRIREGLDVLMGWLWPWGLDAVRPRSAMIQLIPAMLLIGAISILTIGSWRAILRRSVLRPTGAELAAVSGLFIAVYPLFILAAVACFGRTVSFTPRIMLPLMPAGLMVLAVGWNQHVHRFAISRRLMPGCATACALALMVRVAGAVDHCFYRAGSSGIGAQGYHHESWRGSPTIAALGGLSESATIYSNAPDAIYLLTGRRAIWLSLFGKNEDGTDVAPTASVQASGESYIVYFDRLAWRPSSPKRDDLAARWPIRALSTMRDGSIFAVDGVLTRGGAEE